MGTIKRVLVIIPLIALAAAVAIQSIGLVFFMNRTASMPQGIYVKNGINCWDIGCVIVFKINAYKSNLIKYIAGIGGDQYYFDETGSLWINGNLVAQKNIEKYPQPLIEHSICQQLNADELLVIGDNENSYDSRYFGPIKKQEVIATVKLLWQIR